MIPAEPARQPRIRLINPNSPLSNITMPDVIRNMTSPLGRWTPGFVSRHAQKFHFTRKAIFAPTGLMICAAVLPRNWGVELVDECTLDQPHTARADVDLVGISAMTTQARRAYQLADDYRRLGIPVIMGGIHPSALPAEALQHCDAVCRGDAESTLPHAIADFQAAVAQGQPGRTGLKSIYDWATYPSAPIATPRKDVINPADYLVANPIQTTRGCPHNCNFCTTPAVFGRKFRQRDVGDIIDELKAVCEVHKPPCFIFADDNFGGNQAWAEELCERMKPLRVKWASQCDILISKSDRLMAAMRASGCQGLILGLESPRAGTLQEAGKKFVRSDTYAWRIRKIQSHRIGLWGAFIFGFDNDDWRDCMAACHFAQRMDLAMSCYPILTPYPGTEFFRQFEREGRIRTYDWEKYNGASVVYEPKRMTPKQLRHAQMAAFAEFYSLRSSVRRLKALPLKKLSWITNLAIDKGIRYYYAKKHRRVPRFRDFLDLDSRAWRHPDDAWAHTPPAPTGCACDSSAATAIPPPTGTAATAAIAAAQCAPLLQAASDPLAQAAIALSRAPGAPAR
jgi:radical SAM superfamily enzyme YgiQ (UPF0313 family)